LAGTGLTARYKSHRLEAVVCHLDELIEEITVDAIGNDEQPWAFHQAFEDNIDVPCGAPSLVS
jgi:hypothetical protein